MHKSIIIKYELNCIIVYVYYYSLIYGDTECVIYWNFSTTTKK